MIDGGRDVSHRAGRALLRGLRSQDPFGGGEETPGGPARGQCVPMQYLLSNTGGRL